MAEKLIPTGNEKISLPCIREADAAIMDFTFLHMGSKGLIDVFGSHDKPLIKPLLIVDGEECVFSDISWSKKLYWIPHYTMDFGQIKLNGVILAPIGRRGFICRQTYTNLTEAPLTATVGQKGCWSGTNHAINMNKPIDAKTFVHYSGWNRNLVFDMRIGTSLFAFAPMCGCETEQQSEQDSNGAISYVVSTEITIEPGESYTFDIAWGLGYEEVSAVTSAEEIIRYKFEKEYESTERWLGERVKTVGDSQLDRIMNTNLLFNFFFAAGCTIDTEEFVLVTSRSHRYYVSAAYWDRDSLLWSFPSIVLTDTEYAREMLLYVFTKQARNIGTHSRYIDGTVLEPGFELDELCAPVIALNNYVKVSGDLGFLTLPHVERTVESILKKLESEKHDTLPLYRTFLQPTDDMHTYQYLTYDNVLVWRLLTNLAELYDGIWSKQRTAELESAAKEVKEAILHHCVEEYEGKRIFAWSLDLEGHWDVYDEPPGSLQLLPHYGFCALNNEIYQNTVDIIRRPDYKYAFHGYPFAEIGCAHAPHPWVLSIANSLLCGRTEQGRNLLIRAQMDNGIACESINENTGESASGNAFATCAGFLAYAIYSSF